MTFKIKTNTPLRSVPDDYVIEGTGRWFEIPSGYDKGKTMFYSDYVPQNRTSDKTVLFVHGNPENSYTYRHVRAEVLRLGAGARLVSPDHIGFGLSDQATFEMVEMYHANNLRMLIKHLDLRGHFGMRYQRPWRGLDDRGVRDSREVFDAFLEIDTYVDPDHPCSA